MLGADTDIRRYEMFVLLSRLSRSFESNLRSAPTNSRNCGGSDQGQLLRERCQAHIPFSARGRIRGLKSLGALSR